jgi:hypothetical protein
VLESPSMAGIISVAASWCQCNVQFP